MKDDALPHRIKEPFGRRQRQKREHLGILDLENFALSCRDLPDLGLLEKLKSCAALIDQQTRQTGHSGCRHEAMGTARR